MFTCDIDDWNIEYTCASKGTHGVINTKIQEHKGSQPIL